MAKYRLGCLVRLKYGRILSYIIYLELSSVFVFLLIDTLTFDYNNRMSEFLQQFKRQHLNEYLVIALDAFRNNHPQFTKGIINQEDFFRETQKLILFLLQVEQRFNKQNGTSIMFNNAIFEENKLIAAGFGCDLHYYLKYGKGRVNEELLTHLLDVDLSTVPKNTVLVTLRAMVHKDWQNKGIAERCAYQKSVHMVTNGYINEYSLVVNPFTLRVLKRFGSKVWKDVSFEVKGQKLDRYVLFRDMRVMAGIQTARL